MQNLTKGLYFVKEKVQQEDGTTTQITRLWHDCSKYKDRDLTRVEITKTIEDDDSATFVCPFCGFSYVLDKHLKLA